MYIILYKIELSYSKNDMMYKKKVLGSQRALQFGGDPILKRHAHSFKGRVVQFGMETLRKKCYDL